MKVNGSRKGDIKELFLDALDLLQKLVRENARLRYELEEVRGLAKAGTNRSTGRSELSLTPIQRAERDTIVSFLIKTGYNQRIASGLLGIRPNTLSEKIRKYKIPRSERGYRGGRKARRSQGSAGT